MAVGQLHHFRLDDEATRTVVDVVSFTANGISMLEAFALLLVLILVLRFSISITISIDMSISISISSKY